MVFFVRYFQTECLSSDWHFFIFEFDLLGHICSYQNLVSHDQNDEISNPRNWRGSNSEAIFKACGCCYFSINTGKRKRTKEKTIIDSLLLKKGVFKISYLKIRQ